jgi:cell division protein FtsN
MTSKKAPQKAQKPARPAERGGFVIGLIVGLLIGLALALGVALYVTKVPIPFVIKIGDHAPEDDAAEAAKAKNWDPNAPLVPKVIKPILTEPASGAAAGSAPATPGGNAAVPPSPGAASGASQRNPAAILSGQPVSPAAAPMLPPRSTKPEAGAFTYFVQAGAFSRDEDAEQQRAKLAMQGITAKVTQREQSGRTVFRVRVGPFDKKEDAEAAQQKLQQAGTDAALVRVEGGVAAAPQ